MRILVIGAGAVGGYFGARLVEAGRDVTFLVRPARAALLRQGLVVKSPVGDIGIEAPRIVTTDQLAGPYDLILLSCKAYDLDDAIASFAAAVGPDSFVLPLLNGMAHVDALNARFGAARVLGGQCTISATLDDAGHILHLNDMHSMSFGEQQGGRSERLMRVAAALSGARFTAQTSETILLDMWEKWVFIAAAAGMTCLMRAAIGDIIAAGAGALPLMLLDECAAVATRNGFAPRTPVLDRFRAMLSAAGSVLTASMLRDVERGGRIEADHIVGDLLRRGGDQLGPQALLRIAYAHLKAYEARRARESGGRAG
ncbi:MAG: 2-dehydropantoate 2-reductase [Xanthobacteraceae bacterium]|nr:2-dehydropantoate 2-reductase [Xanthobacteraceae bacterium]